MSNRIEDTPVLVNELGEQARSFDRELGAQKQRAAPAEFEWYPYGTLDNFVHLDRLLTGENRRLLDLAGGLPMADIGAADGDMAFFLESLGYHVDAVDYPPTNFNSCRGIRLLKQVRNSDIGLLEVDLDRYFELPSQRYGLAFFLGILYHLKNPFNAVESLARVSAHAVISTRITRYNVAEDARGSYGLNHVRADMSDIPVAYLVDSYETNNDASNFWMFTESGLRRLFDRCGWDVLDFTSVGDTLNSDPASTQGDERAFCLVRSRHFD